MQAAGGVDSRVGAELEARAQHGRAPLPGEYVMNRDVESNAVFGPAVPTPASSRTGASASSGRIAPRRWLKSLLVLWLLLGVAMPAWAACTSPQTATVASGGQAVFNCSLFGFWWPAEVEPSHGSLSEGTPTNVWAVVYTNDGDGALSDSFVLRADDGNITFNITVLPANSLVVSPVALPTPNIGVAYSQALSTSGGTAPYSYSIAGGAFPPGLSLSSTGTISGTPTQSGSHSFSVAVSDSDGQSVNKSYSVNIPAPALDISPDVLLAGAEAAPYSLTLSGSGGTAPYAFRVDSGLGPLPPGLSLANSGAITGTPVVGSAGSYPVRIVMEDRTTQSSSADYHWIYQDFTFVIQPPPTIVVAPATLPNGAAGAPYSRLLSASGGTGPYSFALTSGSLPAGLVLAADGALTGTPTAGGSFAFNVTATDSNGFDGSRAYVLQVTAADIVLSPGLDRGYVGQPYADVVTASGGTAPYSYAITAGVLPPGLVLNAGTGAIAGTATGNGIFGFTVTATDSSTGTGPYSDSLDYEIVMYSPSIDVAPAALPDGRTGDAYTQTFAASGGTAPYSYALFSGSLPPGISLSSAGVLSGTPTTTGTFNFTMYITDSSAGSGPFSVSRNYGLTIASAVPVTGDVSATVAYGSGVNPVGLDLSGGAADSVAVASLPGHGTAIANGTAISYQPHAGYAGPDSFTYTATNAEGSSAPATVSITVSPPVIAITPSAPLTAQVGASYSQTFTWSGGAAPYSAYSVAGLPMGLLVTASDGDSVTVSGTPNQSGSFTVSVSASDSSTGSGPFTADDVFTLQVDAPGLTMTPAAGSALTADYPQPYSQTFSASGGTAPYVYVLTGPLPAGLSFDGTSGTLSGTPAEAGTAFPFTVTVTDSSTGAGSPYSLSQNYVLQVDHDIELTPSTLAGGTVGTSYAQVLAAAGGVAPYTFAMDAGTSLPPGLSLAAGGSIAGTPTASGAYSFSVRASDANGVPGTHGYSMSIAAANLTVTPATLPGGAVGTPYSQTIGASGGIAPYSYAIAAGALPPGFSLDAGTGVLSGSTSAAGSYSFDVQVSDSGGGTPSTATVSYALVIDAPTIVLAPATLADGTVRSAYSQVLSASGGIAPYSFAVTAGSLPDGVSLASDGSLSGTPTETGGFSFSVTATDSSVGSGPYSGTGSYTLTIADVAPTANDVTATVAYNSAATPITLDISGSVATSVAVESAPAHGVATASGLSISYQPDAGYSGPDSFTYIASNAAGDSAPATVSITVGAPTLVLAPAAGTLGPGYGVAYSQAFSVSGGAAPYAYALSGALPAGLAFDAASGVLSGTATESGSFPITVTATDSSTGGSAPFTASASYDMQVAAPTITITPATLADGVAGSAYSQTLSATGGVGPYTFAITSGTLPAGLSLASDGSLSGTPGAEGVFTFTVEARDSNGQPGSHDYTLVVAGVVPVAAAHHVQMLAGSSIEVELTEGASGGPFTAADVLAITPADAGSASVARVGDGNHAGYRLTFTAGSGYAGTATVRYTLSNAGAASAPAAVTIVVAERPDPARDAEVAGLLRAQVESVRRLAEGQIGNFQRRLERLHGDRGGASGFDNGLSVMVDRACAENDWQVVGSTCQRPLSDEQAPVQAPAHRTAAGSRPEAQATPASPFAIWTAGAMRFGDYDPRRGASGFEFETSGLSAGADRRFGPAFALGAGLGYGRDVSDIGEYGSRSRAEAWSAAVYASYHPGEHVYLDGLLGYQRLSFDLRRHVAANDATVAGERDGRQWFVSLAAGYQWQRDQLRLTPYARIDHASAGLDAYVEHGDPLHALAFAQQDVETTTTSLGLRVDYLRDLDWGTFAPQLRLEYQHDLDADSVAVMRYADLPSGPWYRSGIEGFDRNRLELGLGAAWQTRRQFGLRLEYLHRLGNSGVDDQSLLLQMEKQF